MTAASASPCATGGFLDRFKCVVSNTDHLIEGALWIGWFGWTVVDLTKTASIRQQAVGLPDSSAEKADKVYLANKKLFLGACSSLSSSSMVFSWVENVGLISTGFFSPILGVLGYGGSSVGALVRLIDAFKELDQSTIAWGEAKDPLVKRDIALGFCPKLIAIAFLTCAAAWGIFGALNIAVGGATLVLLADLFFKYTLISFLAYFASIILAPLLAHESKNLLPNPGT